MLDLHLFVNCGWATQCCIDGMHANAPWFKSPHGCLLQRAFIYYLSCAYQS
eukprot:c33135_g1_i1 orf=2-151(-)